MINMFKLRYSQKFLQSNKIVKRILSLSSINKNDTVYEIGCGKGIITKHLAGICNNVIGVELDNNLYSSLKAKFRGSSNIKIIEADFLDIHLPKSYPYKVFSNIPFNITTQIIQKLTNINNCPTESYLIVQKEVALKYIGKYGITMQSLLLIPFFDFKIIYEFQKFDFTPVPRVETVLLHIKLKKEHLIERKQCNNYQDFVTYIFSKDKAIIKTAFQELFTYKQLKRLGEDYKFNINDNISSISYNNWIELFNFFIKNVSNEKQIMVANKFRKLKKHKQKKRNKRKDVQ